MKPTRIALTGGIATGKSTVAAMFARLGAIILDADRTAREVSEPGTSCWRRLKELLGSDYFDRDGQLKRRKLRERIVQDAPLRSQVNAILHPCIFDLMQSEWEKRTEAEAGRLVIFDVPLLFEAGAADRFDVVILVYAPPEIQVRRLMARDKLTRHEAEGTLAMQLPIESKKEASDIIIDNSSDEGSTYRQVEEVWKRLYEPHSASPS
jgi:dephospho-CoA kinase